MSDLNLMDDEKLLRLQVYLACCGVASRRTSEKLILSGRVKVNGIVISVLGTKVKRSDRIELDNNIVEIENRKVYLALNKPPKVLCTNKDVYGRPLVIDLLPPSIIERVFTIGRLDYNSSGLILITNDGDFAASIAHPSARIEKEYIVDSSIAIPDSLIDAFKAGIEVENILYRCQTIERLGKRSIRIVLVEGKNREIRRVCSAFHLHPERLIRIRIGPIALGSLAEGKTRILTSAECKLLLAN